MLNPLNLRAYAFHEYLSEGDERCEINKDAFYILFKNVWKIIAMIPAHLKHDALDT